MIQAARTHLRRSLLFVPGNNPGMILAAPFFGADSLVLDLEDSVPTSEKDSARTLVTKALDSVDFRGAEKVVRVNGAASGLLEADLDAVAAKVDSILLPKADAASLGRLAEILSSGPDGSRSLDTKVIALIETSAGLEEAYLCARTPRATALFLGGEDLTLDMGMERTTAGDEIYPARWRVVAAAAAARIDSIDTPYTSVFDEEGLRRDLEVTRRLGFTGRACVHPLQVDIVHEALQPEPGAVDWARRVIRADEDARAAGTGVVTLDGRMIDAPIVARAQHVLERAAAYERREVRSERREVGNEPREVRK